jgi:hypothetical protein
MSEAAGPSPLALALHDVDIAFRQLEFSIKLLSHIELGKLNPDEFDTDHVTLLNGGGLQFPKGPFSTQRSLEQAAAIGVLTAFAATVISLDFAFETAGIAPSIEPNDDTIKLRTLIYMLRNCFAHQIAAPTWMVRQHYQKNLSVRVGNETIALDLAALNGQPFNPAQIGGYLAWYRIRDASLATLGA